jgi:chromosome segregation protein
VADTETELTDIEVRWQAQATEVAEAQSSFQAQQAAFQQQQEEVQRLQETVLGLVARLAEQEQQRQQIEAQRQRLTEERTSHEEAHSNALAETKRWAAELAAISKGIVSQQKRTAKLETQQQQQEEALAAAERQQKEAAEQLAAAERAETRLRDRLDLLTRLQEEGEGYAAGVQALLQGRAKGIIGPVAQCLRVPAQLERAVEASLGSRLQDLVLERRSDAENAIAWLKREGVGRATFLPLDSLRPPPTITPPTGPGVRGVASDLVEADERVQPAVELLLGRTLIVEDLLTAHRVFSQQKAKPAVLQIVTLSGEMVRSDGRMSGGRGSGGSVLARERERRELPVRLQEAAGDVKKAKTALAQAKEKTELGQNGLANSAATIQSLTKDMERQLARQAEAQRPLDLARQREAWYRDLFTQTESELTRLRENTTILSADTEQLQERQSEDRAKIQGKEARSAELSSQQAELESEIAAHQAEAEALTAQLQEFTALIEPAEADLEQLAAEQVTLESKERSLQKRLRQEEVRASKVSLAVERQQHELLTLHRDIDADLGPMKLRGVETLTFLQPLLPLRMPAEKLPTVQKLPQEVEVDIRRLRRMGRQLGRVNPNAPAEYEEALERHHFLTGQAKDLEQASESLREVIAELDQLMEQEFERTFLAIANQFKEYFTTLFGGGSARLELTAPDDLTHTGVEIIARPPGKRAQSLALLSGGERSLTAMALIFAILRVSPPPFCVLDEVDAMLDEANVGRFRTLLKELSTNTQFVIITHNRGTIEAADTIYGVSMGADSVSLVVSLKLHGEQIAD